MSRAALTLAGLLFAGCVTLPGHQGGPGPRSTQYTYPGRAVNPDTGQGHSPIPHVAEPADGGRFVYGFVFADGSTGLSLGHWDSLAACERDRGEYATLLAQRGDRVMTVRCYRAHEPGVLQTR